MNEREGVKSRGEGRGSRACRLQTGDTAGCNPALRTLRWAAASPSPRPTPAGRGGIVGLLVGERKAVGGLMWVGVTNGKAARKAATNAKT